MNRTLRDLARDGVTTLPLYSTEAAHCAVDLSDNTNLWGSPPAALAALRLPGSDNVARYPSLYSEPLRNQLLEYVGLTNDSTFDTITGCGSDDVLDATMRAFSANNASIAYSSPTFSIIPVLARLNGLTPHSIPFTGEMDIDAERLVDARAAITYLCTPNNPTATAASRAAVEFVVRHATGVVLIDEAYAEFAPDRFIDLVSERDNVLVARTFSKAFGLAGLRVGYGVGARELTRLVARARGPYKVNAMAERAVRASLQDIDGGIGWVRARAQDVIANRAQLAEALTARGLDVLPSAANFVFVPTRNATTISRGLVERGVLVRVMSGIPEEPDALASSGGTGLRIGVGPWEMMQRFLEALDAVL